MSPQKILDNLAEFIREQREQRGMSISKFSKLCGVSGESISVYERGKQFPTLYTLCLIANALDVSLDEMCGWEAGD